MKKLLLQLLVCATALFPLAHAETASFAGKTFGGFPPGATFKLTMNEVPVATTAGLSGVKVLKNIPAGYPKYKKGSKVTFKIGKKGELMVGNFSIPFRSTTATGNTYSSKSSVTTANLSQAAFTKANGKVTFMNLVLRKVSGSGFSTKTTQIMYLLE
jgi:hypothetical protein